MEEKTNCILCNNSSQRTVNRNITFHSFPRNPTRRARWLQALNLKDCTDWHRVCSEHFAPSDFRPGEKRLLWPFALPKPGLVTQTSETSNTDDANTTNDSTQVSAEQNDSTQVSTEQNDSTLQNLNEQDNSVTNSQATSSTVTGSTSTRRSCRKIKPSSLSDDSTYVNTLDSSLIPSDQEEDVNNTTHKKKKKKENVSNGMRCSAKNCQNKYPMSNVSFFGFPNDLSIRKIWVKNCGIEDLVGPNCIVKSYFKVCRFHFEEDMFYNTLKKNRLVANAIPTIFINEGKSQSLHSNSESVDIVEDSSTNNDLIIESPNLLSIQKKPKVLWNHEYIDTQCDGEPNACCIPGCIYSADYLNGKTNANPRPVALFTPSSDENVNDWGALSGLCLNMKSKLCERHFNANDITSKDIFIPKKGVGKVKALRYDALPVKIKKYGGALKRSRIIFGNEDVPAKMTKNNTDKSTKFGELPEDANIEIIENDPSTSILSSTIHLNSKSIDALSNITSNRMENNSHSSLQQILPKILANNSLSISLHSNAQQNKQVSITESTKVTNAISGLNQNKKPVEELSSNSPHSSIVTNLQSNFGQIPTLSINDGSLSVTLEKKTIQNAQISPIEVANSVCEIKSEPLDDENISILNTSANNTFSITSSKENKKVFPGVEIIGVTIFKSDEVKSEIIDDIPEAINSYSNTDNSIVSTNSILKSEPIDDVSLVDDSQLNIEQPLPNTSILLTALQSNCTQKTAVNNSVSNPEYSEFILNEKDASDSLSTIPNIHPNVIEKQTAFKSKSSNVPCEIIDICEQDTPSAPTEPHSIKDFITNCKNVLLPSQFWISFYNPSQNMAVFIQRDEFLNPCKRVYFRNCFVPNIYINGKPYEYQRAVKTKCDLENLLEDIDDIIICSGYDGYSHETCIGYFENTSEEIEVCRNCQLLIKGKFLRRTDATLKTKANILIHLNNKVAQMQIKVANTRKKMLKEKKRY